MRHRRRVLVAAGLFLAACTSTTTGSGRTSDPSDSSTPVTSDSTSGPSAPGTTPVTTPVTTPRNFPPPNLRRHQRDSTIGDPATADLCAAVGLAPFEDVDTSLTPTFDAEQYPPGCSITLTEFGEPVLTVSVFAARHRPRQAEGRTRSKSNGLDVFSYPFEADTGSCERDVVAGRVVLLADTLGRRSTEPDEALACAAADAMAETLAAAVVAGSVGPLTLAEPSLTELDACAVVRLAGITSLGTYATAATIPRGFALNCELRTDDAFLFLNVTLAETARAASGTPVTVDGHELFESAARPGFCSYHSKQGSTGSGDTEWMTATATAPGAGAPPEQLCADTAQALALYLTAAGLP